MLRNDVKVLQSVSQYQTSDSSFSLVGGNLVQLSSIAFIKLMDDSPNLGTCEVEFSIITSAGRCGIFLSSFSFAFFASGFNGSFVEERNIS
mmetsp:Transcript_29909/g.60367  ORF Transcript_29909/g.60367 Transcript_29909/m.60367 type:complete len:91 (+) Transcript_29909:324-596(+)